MITQIIKIDYTVPFFVIASHEPYGSWRGNLIV